ncbi:histidine kinase dimerization/phosphoacceptor domain-containing protein [Streptomyces sp. NBC_01214]|uniref:histidine kinase dimerization/phosphoacceptor domain-containing protein n=1 Tax=Streptomyces sp. NBC_01214 TaxID=2903777 RepID=UPI00338D40AF
MRRTKTMAWAGVPSTSSWWVCWWGRPADIGHGPRCRVAAGREPARRRGATEAAAGSGRGTPRIHRRGGGNSKLRPCGHVGGPPEPVPVVSGSGSRPGIHRRHCTRRASLAALAVSFAVQLLVIGVFADGDNLTVNVVIALLGIATSCTVGLPSRERREHPMALRSQEVAKAVTAERLRIARELHDMVARSMGIVAVQAGVGSRVIHPARGDPRGPARHRGDLQGDPVGSSAHADVAPSGRPGCDRTGAVTARTFAGAGARRTAGGSDLGCGGTRRRAPQRGAASFAYRHHKQGTKPRHVVG